MLKLQTNNGRERLGSVAPKGTAIVPPLQRLRFG